MFDQEHIGRVLAILEETYPEAQAELDFRNPFEMLVATILSAQCTDKQVNRVTATLFQRFPGPQDFAALTPEELEPHIRSCGFYHTKAKNIVATSRRLVEEFGGRVPENLEVLQQLPGVGRKTANVVVSNAFGQDAIAVDTHVFRVSNRLGLARAKDVWKTEQQLMENIPKEKWSRAHHWLIWHGRRVCKAQRPLCPSCPLADDCPYWAGIREKATKEAR